MEIMTPSPPPSPATNHQFLQGHARDHDQGEPLLHIAVGKSPEKTMALLRWAFGRFACCGRRVALLHIHQPSPVIPTLLGKIPAAQATEELVLSHRRSEKDDMNKILLTYLTFCNRAQVQASLLVTENEQIHDGIVTFVRDHGVTKLVMGSIPDNCFKLKASHSKEYFMAKNAPAFCEIWFVWRGRHIWTREASAAISNSNSVYKQDDVLTTKRIRFSSNSNGVDYILHDGYITSGTSTAADPYEGHVTHNGWLNHQEDLGADSNHFYNMHTSNLQDTESAFNSTFWLGSSVHGGALFQEMLDKNVKQVMMEAERSRKEAFIELLKRKETESKVSNTFGRAKVAESNKKREMKLKEDLEGLFIATRKQHQDLTRNKEQAIAVLDSCTRRLGILDARAENISLEMDEAVEELEVILSSIEILRQEKAKMQKIDDGQHESRCTLPSGCSAAVVDDSYTLRELILSDMQVTTYKFSEEMVQDAGRVRRQVPSFFVCPILGKMMDDPQVGADGLTYEGHVIRERMEDGKKTSPVTKLKWKHLNLTPNHALRFAIQDWLSLHSHPHP